MSIDMGTGEWCGSPKQRREREWKSITDLLVAATEANDCSNFSKALKLVIEACHNIAERGQLEEIGTSNMCDYISELESRIKP